MKIVFTDSKTVASSSVNLEVLKQFGEVVLYDATSEEELAERIKDADIALCNKTKFTAAALEQAKNLKYIGLFATGYNNIDIEYASEKGIVVCNAGSYSTDAVAQHTFALILELFSKVSAYHRFVADGGWKTSTAFSPMVYETHELSGKTLGIIGYGSIGKAVAEIALAFRMNVLVYTRTQKEDSRVDFVSLDELVSRSDVVTVHCPLNPQSEKMFNTERFAQMKKTAYFINTARGGVVDELALKNALENHTIAGAAIDTITTEPMTQDCVLYGVKNLIITPHVAWAANETLERLVKIVVGNIQAFLDGNPINQVN